MKDPTFWQNLRAWLKEEKTQFDFKDRTRALVFLVVIMWIVKLLLDVFYKSS